MRLSILLLFASIPALSQSADEAAVRELVKQYVDARERRDATAVAALFTNDADQLVSNGEWRKGKKEVVRGAMASSAANTGRRTIEVQAVRFLAPTVAIADGKYVISGGDGGAPARNMWASIVAVRESGGWRIAAIRNMLPAPSR